MLVGDLLVRGGISIHYGNLTACCYLEVEILKMCFVVFFFIFKYYLFIFF